MHVLSAIEMQTCDRVTTDKFGIPSLDLMRHAAASIANFAQLQFPRAMRVTVLCGRGNNGGDGMMAARLLADAGLKVAVLLLGKADALKGDALVAWRELESAQTCQINVVDVPDDLASHGDLLQTDLILDAIVGTGFQPPLKGLPLAAFDWVTSSAAQPHAPILAVDLPSGWPADSTAANAGELEDVKVFPADAVITFTAPKPAHVFGQLTRRWDQPVVVAPIGSPDEAIVSGLGLEWAGTAQALTLRPRAAASNKGSFGHVLVVGGSFGSAGGKAGAPAMTSLAAMRAGAGLVTAAVPAPALPVISSFAPELMTWPLAANAEGQATPENLAPERVAALSKGITVLAIGPGLGQSDDTGKFCTGFLKATGMPAVIDADALNILAQQPVFLASLAAQGRTIVITPHPGEMARLAALKTAEVQANRLEVARGFATRHQVTVVLKGARTLIAHPTGRVAVSTTGNPGMAKGGSGDLLTGIVAALLAQYPHQVESAVEAAVFLHGLAADLAVEEGNEHTLLATDSLSQFSRAFRFRSRAANGYVWLQGLPPDFSPVKNPREEPE
jgi:NAD(P)H-hydrate epimerase